LRIAEDCIKSTPDGEHTCVLELIVRVSQQQVRAAMLKARQAARCLLIHFFVAV
jgi:hypothetical protein